MEAFTNDALQKMITAYGDRIFCIVFDNAFKIFIGYDSSEVKSVNDLTFSTEHGIDLIGVKSLSSLPSDRAKGVSFTTYHATALIQHVCVMDEGFEDYRIDPMVSR